MRKAWARVQKNEKPRYKSINDTFALLLSGCLRKKMRIKTKHI